MATATEKEMEVAAILLELSTTILARELPHHHHDHVSSIKDLPWGAKRRRSVRRYRKKEALAMVEREGKSFAGVLLCAQKGGRDVQLGARPTKPVKKKKAKKDIVMERKKEVASLTKENEDLKKELAEQMEKLENLRATNTTLKDHKTLDELKPAVPNKSTTKKGVTLVLKLSMERIPLPPLELVAATDDQNCRPGSDMKAQPSEDMAECEVKKAPLMCRCDREEIQEKVAMSAHARKRRLEIVREKKVYKRRAGTIESGN